MRHTKDCQQQTIVHGFIAMIFDDGIFFRRIFSCFFPSFILAIFEPSQTAWMLHEIRASASTTLIFTFKIEIPLAQHSVS